MKRIMILHKEYRLYEPENFEDCQALIDLDAMAMCDFNERIIIIPMKADGVPLDPQYRQDLLEHEIIHALLEAGGHDGNGDAANEDLVEVIRFIGSYIRTTGVLRCL